MTKELKPQEREFRDYINSVCHAVYDRLQLDDDGRHAKINVCDVRCVVEEEKIDALCDILQKGYQKGLLGLAEIDATFPELFYGKHRNDTKPIKLILQQAEQKKLVKKQKPKLKHSLEVLFESIG